MFKKNKEVNVDNLVKKAFESESYIAMMRLKMIEKRNDSAAVTGAIIGGLVAKVINKIA